MSKEPPEYEICADLDQAVTLVRSWLSKEDVATIKANGSEKAHAMGHHGFGTMVRNRLGLWVEEQPLHQWFRTTYGLDHADDMSGIILGKAFAEITNEPFDIDAQVRRYKDHWAKYAPKHGDK